jgi:hypothetical protein
MMATVVTSATSRSRQYNDTGKQAAFHAPNNALWVRMASFESSTSALGKRYIDRTTTACCHFNWFCLTFCLFSNTPLEKSSLHTVTA